MTPRTPRVFFGWWVAGAFAVMVFVSTGIFILMFLVHDSPAGLLLLALLGGASMAGSLGMTSALTADIFGRFSVASVFGTIFLVHQAGAAAGSWLGGFLFELTGGYGVAFAVASAQLVVAAFVSLAIDERSRCWVPSPAVARAG